MYLLFKNVSGKLNVFDLTRLYYLYKYNYIARYIFIRSPELARLRYRTSVWKTSDWYFKDGNHTRFSAVPINRRVSDSRLQRTSPSPVVEIDFFFSFYEIREKTCKTGTGPVNSAGTTDLMTLEFAADRIIDFV